MGALGIVLLVVFVIVCALLVLLVAVQDDGENGMGGLLGGRGTAAFGSHSANVLTKTTCVLVVLFFVLSVGLAMVNKGSKLDEDIGPAQTEATEETTANGEWWNNESTEAPAEDAAPVEESTEKEIW